MKILISVYVAVFLALAVLYFMGGGTNQRFLIVTSVVVLTLCLALLASYFIRLRR